MQATIGKRQMDAAAVADFLASQASGVLATIDRKGYPYMTPMHFVYLRGNVYVHGRARGEKITNIKAASKVGFQVHFTGELVQSPDRACGTNTAFKSVIVRGEANIVEDTGLKRKILEAFVEKYTPQHKGRPFAEKAFENTAIIEIKPCHVSGKQSPPSE